MDLLQILSDHNIDHTTEHHHSSPGWVQVHCPFCPGKRNYHLGLKLDGKGANCWRCGGHDPARAISTLLVISYRDAKRLLGLAPAVVFRPQQQKQVVRPITLRFPAHEQHLPIQHRQYLLRRGFDADQIIRDYRIVGTGPVGDYKWRILIPIYREGQLISYMGRDISGRADARYKNCPGEQQVFPAKSWLYDLDRCEGRDRILVVEGPTDVWRMGFGSVATMGISWSWEQAALLTGFKTVFTIFDPEDQAQEQERKLIEVLTLGGVNAEAVGLNAGEKDPGSLSLNRVKYLRRWLGL